jgi:hypothetical protein
MKLREMLSRSEARRIFHPIQSRDALIAYFRRHQVVHRSELEKIFRAK